MRISGIGLIQKDPSSKDVILSAKMAESRDVRIAVQWIIGTTIALIETQMAVKLRISWKVSTLWKQGAIRALLYSITDLTSFPPQRIAEFWTPHVLRAYVMIHGLADLSERFLRLQEKWLRKSIPKRNLCLEMENHHGRNTRFGYLLKYALLDVL